jgi:hypothetical protein
VASEMHLRSQMPAMLPASCLQAYIAAAEMHPRDVEILEGLFKSHVR